MITNHDLDLIGPAVDETPSTTPPCPDHGSEPGSDDRPEGESAPAD